MRVLRGHTGPVRTVAFSPVGGLLASGGDDGTVRFWSLSENNRWRIAGTHRDCVRALAFSSDGTRLASAGWDDTVVVGPTGRQGDSTEFEGHVAGAWSLAFSPGAKLLATGAGDGTVFFRFLRTEKRISRREHGMPVCAITFTPDGRSIITASHDRKIIFWDAAWNKARQTLSIHDDWVRSLTVSPDGRLLASAADDGVIILTYLKGHPMQVSWRAHAGPVGQVAFTPRGDAFLSVGWDGVARQYDLGGRETAAYAWEAGRLLCLAVAPDGMTAAAGAENGGLVVWDLEE